MQIKSERKQKVMRESKASQAGSRRGTAQHSTDTERQRTNERDISRWFLLTLADVDPSTLPPRPLRLTSLLHSTIPAHNQTTRKLCRHAGADILSGHLPSYYTALTYFKFQSKVNFYIAKPGAVPGRPGLALSAANLKKRRKMSFLTFLTSSDLDLDLWPFELENSKPVTPALGGTFMPIWFFYTFSL